MRDTEFQDICIPDIVFPEMGIPGIVFPNMGIRYIVFYMGIRDIVFLEYGHSIYSFFLYGH